MGIESHRTSAVHLIHAGPDVDAEPPLFEVTQQMFFANVPAEEAQAEGTAMEFGNWLAGRLYKKSNEF